LFNVSGLTVYGLHLDILRILSVGHVQGFFEVQDKFFFVVGHFFSKPANKILTHMIVPVSFKTKVVDGNLVFP